MFLSKKSIAIALSTAVLGLSAVSANAETRITYKSAKSTSSYYQMAVQIAEAMKAGTDGSMIVTVEESQGSVQNVMEVKARGGDYVFTTPPSLVRLSKSGGAMFKVETFLRGQTPKCRAPPRKDAA